MFKFALKNMAVRKGRILLVILSIVISATVALLSYNVSTQINEGIVSTAGYYDMIIGPSGSATQLAMNTMFFTDKPLGTIPYTYVEELRKSGAVNAVVPFTMGDSFNSSRIVGTTPQFLDGKELKEGAMFAETYEAVVGATVAERYHLKVGDQIVTSHGLGTAGTEHAASPLTVTGILRRTDTAYDTAVFTSYRTVWAIHGSEEEEEGEEEEEEGVEATEGQVCAILVRTKSFSDYTRLSAAYGENSQLLVINPATVLREVLAQVDQSSKIVYILCVIILLMNIMVISVITLLNLFDSRKEISLMRLIGIGMKKVAGVYLIQNSLIGLVSVLLSLLLSHLCLKLMGSFVASMGVVLNIWHVYPLELAIAALVFVISVLPTMISIGRMSRKDGIGD